tara:strand:+ start:116711 stop:117082 length:372 start_codon:yes stop_codon:yes gene_type:complete
MEFNLKLNIGGVDMSENLSFGSNLDLLCKTIEQRKNSDEEKKSYTRQLLNRGVDHIAQKVGEESTELVISSANKDKDSVIYESADLIYHMIVLWRSLEISPTEIGDELNKRQGISGIEEKESR